MQFSERAWAEITPVYNAVLGHPFIRELAAGTLSRERFRFYLVQDALYLTEFSRALSLVAARAPDTDTMMQFEEYAKTALTVERALHETFLRQLGLDSEAAARTEMSVTCFAYTSYLLATAHRGPFEVAVAAVLPCFWIYWEVGQQVHAEAAPSNPYRLWIDTYQDETFGKSVRAVIATADEAAAAASSSVVDEMTAAFCRAARLEWMFWDSAYRLERWPV